jgi:hypothetical protein
MVTMPVLSCVISNNAESFAGSVAVSTKETSSYLTFVHPANKMLNKSAMDKNFIDFMSMILNN